MPFFQDATDIKISGGEFNDVVGNLTKTDSSITTTNKDSHNTTITKSTNSNNDASLRLVDPTKKVKPTKQAAKKTEGH